MKLVVFLLIFLETVDSVFTGFFDYNKEADFDPDGEPTYGYFNSSPKFESAADAIIKGDYVYSVRYVDGSIYSFPIPAEYEINKTSILEDVNAIM